MPPILSTTGLSRVFGRLCAVDQVSLAVDAGEAFGLLGRNGAGKSTFIKMLTTLLPPTSGAAAIGGFDVRRQSMAVRRLIGYVPQAISADGELSGYDNLLVFAKIYDIPRRLREQRIRENLDFMGLADAAAKLVKTYSGGMVRRLEIAQSMLHRPAILFLDEPTIGLDPVARDAVWRHLKQLRAVHRTTIFLTTHYMKEAEELCTRIGIMRRGKIVALGSQAELKAACSKDGATLEDIFAHYTGDATDTDGGYREIAKARKKARRLQ